MGLIRLIALLSNPFVIAVIILVFIGCCMPDGLMDFFAGVTAIVIIVGIVMMFVKLFK